MDDITLKLGKKSFKLSFGLKLLRILGKKWQLPGIDEVVQKIAVLDNPEGKLTFEQMDILEEIIIAAIECGGETEGFKDLDILDEFLKDPKDLENFLAAIVNSLPKNEPAEEGK